MNKLSWARLLVAGSLLLACGDDDEGTPDGAGDGDTGDGDADAGGGGGGDACPNLAGTWTIKEHCGGAPLIGMTVRITQDGCELTVRDMGQFTGSVDEDGAFTLDGTSVTGDSVSCSGTASSSKIEETCAGNCDVVFEK